MVSLAKVLLAVFGLTVVVVLIAVPTAIFLNDSEGGGAGGNRFTLEDAFNSSLKPSSYNLRWISDDEYLHQTNGSVFRCNAVTGHVEEFLSGSLFVSLKNAHLEFARATRALACGESDLKAYDYQLSADHKYAAFMSNYTKQWRHSFNATYTIYDVVNKTFVEAPPIPEGVQYFAWAPTGNKLAYVLENDVYVKSHPAGPAQRVTSTGKHNVILNGIPDWVYEEEMFSSNHALWWSPGGSRVAYAVFDDTDVHAMEYSWYGDEQYPSTVVIPYPKPGTPNPVVTLMVVDTNAVTTVMPVAIPPAFNTGDHYLATVTWSLAMNQKNGWIGRFSPEEPVFAPDKSSYYLVKSDAEGFKHIHRVVAGKATPLTSGPWEVISILKVTAGDIVLGPQGTECLTCTLDKDCQYNSAHFSHNASFYRMNCYGPGTPRYSLRDNNKGTEVRVLEDNSRFLGLISDRQMPSVRLGVIPLKDFDITYQLILPPGFDESKKYPLLVDVYAGPCSQKVDLRYRVGWSSYLASGEGIIVASFDGRGSGYRGDKLMHAIYRRLGTYEVEDQITAVQELTKMGFIDKERIAIWGWSYGGYADVPWRWEPEANSTVTGRANKFHSVQYLLVHGTADDNVHFQQAAQISKALVDNEVDFEAMWYTDKDHGLGGFAYEHVYTHMSHFLLRCFA
ncbi:hypothetical protein CRUP_008681 [Coryphaenoides rupestris]|nr:hypothetical protein CRUP_008681 [Coryphaenoides rupestris]